MSPKFPRRWVAPVAAAAAVGLAATPAVADQVRHREWWLSAVHVSTAWQNSRGGGVTVAVLDSGVDPAQPDLAGSVKAGPDYTHTSEAPGSVYWGGHGTGMAALIAGHGHGHGGADGTMGIAPAARILSIRVVPDRGDPALADPAVAGRLPDAIAAGIRYAASHGARVIDLPLDPGSADAASRGAASAAGAGSTAERNAVRYALAMGAVLVAPAGDDRARRGAINYPAAYPGVMAVGAIDRNFDLASFSSRQSYVTLTGPGVDVGTARPGGSYPAVSSTTAASAIVAGVAAIVRAEYPGLQGSQVTQALTQGTMFRHAKRAGSGYGAVDAVGALHAAAAISAASPASPAASPSASTAGSAQPQPAFPGNVLRVLIGVAVAAVLITVALLMVRARLRRRRARRSGSAGPSGASPDSPLSGGLSGPAPEISALAAPPGPDRRPRLAPVAGLPGRHDVKLPARPPGSPPPWQDAAKPSGSPPWEDAPMPTRPPPEWPSADDAANPHASRNGQADGEVTQAFSPEPAHSVSFNQAIHDDPALYEEDEQPFDDEDDRHL